MPTACGIQKESETSPHANRTVWHLLKSDWLTYKVNRDILRISVVRLWGRIEGTALVRFISLVRFRNHRDLWIKKYWIYYILDLRPNAHLVFFRHVPRRVCAIARLSVISLTSQSLSSCSIRYTLSSPPLAQVCIIYSIWYNIATPIVYSNCMISYIIIL